MLGKTLLSVGALLAVGSADVAPGFPIPASAQLSVSYGNNTVSPPGELIPRPGMYWKVLLTPSWSSSPGVLLMVDLDVPLNGTRVQLLHWLATNVTLANPLSSTSPRALTIPNGPVPYLQPSPPVGDSPHDYTWILFPQPVDFSIPAKYSNLTNARVPFNVSQFVADVGLGTALAGNWIMVQNLTGSATTSYPPARTTVMGSSTGTATGSMATTTSPANATAPVEFPGAAVQVLGGSVMWVGVATAMLAGFAAVVL
ncbi:PEBP-like protein [Dothidotthia symphoricarpi CBS 119687]|uniref:PEBP-like protein n=1 Tax=Dothidotthia symphoricarpi CBS 119687 TaxID=1392245 RepID=A0A6A6AE48_9PLEO|nr:PEBP-like protein [Dothidotthia symphoricarpi CBS 119687]KAF2129846.1 PEBP-like protein [Dothidotthia symphoricarpi CBS 119687]